MGGKNQRRNINRRIDKRARKKEEGGTETQSCSLGRTGEGQLKTARAQEKKRRLGPRRKKNHGAPRGENQTLYATRPRNPEGGSRLNHRVHK